MNEKYLIDIRAWAPGSVIQIPENMDVRDVVLVRDKRSPMIRLLDDPAWRESLKVAETPQRNCWFNGGCVYWIPCVGQCRGEKVIARAR